MVNAISCIQAVSSATHVGGVRCSFVAPSVGLTSYGHSGWVVDIQVSGWPPPGFHNFGLETSCRFSPPLRTMPHVVLQVNSFSSVTRGFSFVGTMPWTTAFFRNVAQRANSANESPSRTVVCVTDDVAVADACRLLCLGSVVPRGFDQGCGFATFFASRFLNFETDVLSVRRLVLRGGGFNVWCGVVVRSNHVGFFGSPWQEHC